MSEVRAAHEHAVSVAPVSEPIHVGGLFETHLSVSDLGRSVAFYRDIVGLPLALEVPERRAAFFWIGKAGEAMLGLWSLGSAPIGFSLHVAFKAALGDVLGACERLRSLGVTPLSFFAAETTEPNVIGWMPAAAVYFRDPDGHLLEYLAILDSPPDPEAGVVSWSQWVARRGRGASDRARAQDEHDASPDSARAVIAMTDGTVRLDAYRRRRRADRPARAPGIARTTW